MRRTAPPLSGFELEIPVRFSECDLYGVVWHGRYAVYLEEARNAITAKFGWTVSRAKEAGYLVPVIRMEIDYLSPAKIDTVVRVTARLREPIVPRLVFDYEIHDRGGRLLCRAVTDQVVTRQDGELLLSLPGFLKELVAAIVSAQDEPGGRRLP